MKAIRFKYKTGDFVVSKTGEEGYIEELRFREGCTPQYAVWHRKDDYTTYSEDQLLPKVLVQGELIGFKTK